MGRVPWLRVGDGVTTTTTDFGPDFRLIGSVLSWCYQPNPRATDADLGNVEAWLEDKMRRMTDRLEDHICHARYGDAASLAADISDHARAAAALKLQAYRRRVSA